MANKKISICLLAAFVFIAWAWPACAAVAPKKPLPHLLFFHSATCHNCQKIEKELLPAIEKEFFDRLIVEYCDIADEANYKLMLSLREKYKCYENGVPAVFIGGQILVGYDQIKEKLRPAIEAALGKDKLEKVETLPGIDLASKFLSFGALTVLGAGLIDGINPCAFTVIVFFISFLSFQGYRKKEIAAIGLSFILAVFLTYILIGLGIFRFLYALQGFYLATRIVYYLMALLCFALAFLAGYDLWLFKKTGKTEGMTLQLPERIKKITHYLIGSHYRRPEEPAAQDTHGQLFRLVLSAFICGFLIAILEGVCTGQLYLPTIVFMLKNTTLRLYAFIYLLLYNIMFVIPLLAIIVLALLGTTSEGFARFIRKHLPAVKLAMVLLFLGLGIFILAAG
jgi:cytochrome c biogenesis protein CcdA